MRYSQQRETILEVVRGTKSHPTAAWVHQQVQNHIARISVGTVYRNLNQLADHGVIKRILDNGRTRFDGQISRHDHFRCTACDKIFDLYIPTHDIRRHLPHDEKFVIQDFAVDVTGLCTECSTNKTPIPR